jgi:hypothetical protein
MEKINVYFLALVFIMLFTLNADLCAQGPPGGGGPGPCTNPPCNNPPLPPGLAPIDGGAVFLLISGITLGVISLRKKQE